MMWYDILVLSWLAFLVFFTFFVPWKMIGDEPMGANIKRFYCGCAGLRTKKELLFVIFVIIAVVGLGSWIIIDSIKERNDMIENGWVACEQSYPANYSLNQSCDVYLCYAYVAQMVEKNKDHFIESILSYYECKGRT